MSGFVRALTKWARIARRLPPSGDCYPVIDPYRGDRVLAVMVAGKGLVTNFDLKDFGIKKPIPFVRERSVAHRLVELFRSEAAAITSMAALRAARQEITPFYETQSFPGGTGIGDWNTWVQNLGNSDVDPNSSMPPAFRLNNGSSGATCYSAIPGGSAPDNTNGVSLLGWTANPSGSNTKYITGFSCQAWDTASNSLFSMTCVADLLIEAKLSIEVSTTQTVNTTALTRYTTGLGVLAGLFVDLSGAAAMTPDPSTVTIKYTNPAGTTNRTITHPVGGGFGSGTYWYDSNNLNSSIPFMPLQAGDTGIKSIESYQAGSVATPAATGDVLGLHMYKPLIWLPGVPDYQTFTEYDFTMLPQLFYPLAATAGGKLGCITLYQEQLSSNGAGIRGSFTCVEG